MVESCPRLGGVPPPPIQTGTSSMAWALTKEDNKEEPWKGGEPVPEDLKPRVNSLNKAIKRQMYELHRKAREMAQERDPKKLEEWEKQQKEWLEIVAKEDQERRSQGSASDGKRSKKDASDGTHCRPDPGYRARSLSVGRRLAKDGQPRGTPFLPAEEGTIIAEGDDEKGDGTLPEKGKHKKRKKAKNQIGSKKKKTSQKMALIQRIQKIQRVVVEEMVMEEMVMEVAWQQLLLLLRCQ